MYFNIKDYLKKLGIEKGDTIVLASSILNLSIIHKNLKKTFLPNEIINQIQFAIGKNGTLLINSFNWDFCKGIDFDPNKTLSRTGTLSNIALKRKDFMRTKNPIYSFMVSGKNHKKICKIEHNNCFSKNSPFGYLIDNKAKYLFIDIDYKKTGFVLVHVAEQEVGVNYRYLKTFKGNVISKNKKIEKSVKMYVKKLKFNIGTTISPKMDQKLIKNNALKKIYFKNIPLSLIDIEKSYKIMLSDLKKDKKLVITYKKNV